MEATVDERRELLAQDLDFAGLEQAITAQMNALGAELVKQVVEPLLVDEDYVERSGVTGRPRPPHAASGHSIPSSVSIGSRRSRCGYKR